MNELSTMCGLELEYVTTAKNKLDLIKIISKKLSKIIDIENDFATIVQASN